MTRRREPMRERFSREQILGFLREAEAGASVMELCWNHCFSRSTFNAWKSKYRAAIDAETGRMKQLERENARLRSALARLGADPERLRRHAGNGSAASRPPKFGRRYRGAATANMVRP